MPGRIAGRKLLSQPTGARTDPEVLAVPETIGELGYVAVDRDILLRLRILLDEFQIVGRE
jgi:hypothetical protein